MRDSGGLELLPGSVFRFFCVFRQNVLNVLDITLPNLQKKIQNRHWLYIRNHLVVIGHNLKLYIQIPWPFDSIDWDFVHSLRTVRHEEFTVPTTSAFPLVRPIRPTYPSVPNRYDRCLHCQLIEPKSSRSRRSADGVKSPVLSFVFLNNSIDLF